MATLNSPQEEISPWIAPDNQTIYFSSGRAGGLGENDIWMSRRLDDSKVDLDDDGVRELSDARPAPDRELLDKELDFVMRDALSRLDEDKRLVFTLKVLQQKSYEEISDITGSSVGKLKTDLHRARNEMRKRIGPYLGGEQ